MKVCEVFTERELIMVGNCTIFDLETAVGKRSLATILRKIANDLDPYKEPDTHVMSSYA